jgi:hypothetical protein
MRSYATCIVTLFATRDKLHTLCLPSFSPAVNSVCRSVLIVGLGYFGLGEVNEYKKPC